MKATRTMTPSETPTEIAIAKVVVDAWVDDAERGRTVGVGETNRPLVEDVFQFVRPGDEGLEEGGAVSERLSRLQVVRLALSKIHIATDLLVYHVNNSIGHYVVRGNDAGIVHVFLPISNGDRQIVSLRCFQAHVIGEESVIPDEVGNNMVLEH